MSLSPKRKRQEDALNLSKDLVFQAIATLTLASRPADACGRTPPPPELDARVRRVRPQLMLDYVSD